MTEQEVHQLLLVRAIDREAAEGAALPWTPADADMAAAQARRRVGERGSAGEFAAAWAQAALQRLGVTPEPAAQDGRSTPLTAALARWARPATGRVWAIALLVAMVAFGLGALGDAWASDGRIQLLSLPLIGLMVWNLLVYAWAALTAGWAGWWRLVQRGRRRSPEPAAQALRALKPLVAAATWMVQPLGARWPGGIGAAWQQVRRRQLEGLEPIVAGLWQRRAAALLHLAAASWALGMVASMYGRGMVLDFRAGWASTFLDAAQVHALLGWLLAPGLAWPGLELPDVATIAALRWADGAPGASAAPWIHRASLSLTLLVILPRLAWAVVLAGRVHYQARHLMLRVDDAYFARWPSDVSQARRPVTVLPYNCHDSVVDAAPLYSLLQQCWGPGVELHWSPVLPMGCEDRLPQVLPTETAPDVVVLMSLNATPESESHGAFLRRLKADLPRTTGLHLVLDAAGFERRLVGQGDAATRLAARAQLWQALAAESGWPAPRLLSLPREARVAHQSAADNGRRQPAANPP